MVRAGCEVVRLAVPDNDAAHALKEIRKRVPMFPRCGYPLSLQLALLAWKRASTSCV
jgi:4-hydroxy-3-methylbut-2-en-1-yl diphosphate synthase IspG/GcpE